MPVHVALTAGELTALGAPTSVRVLCAVPPLAQETARVNMPGGLSFPLAQLTINSLSANFLTNVKVGQSVDIGSSAGGRERGRYRIRQAPTSDTLYIGEIGAGDAGRIVHNLRSATIQHGDYITVYTAHYDLWSVFGIIDYDDENVAFYKDVDRAYVNENSSPPPIVNLGAHRWLQPDSGQTYATTSITASVPTPWIGTVSGYSWSAPGWTNTSGTTTATLSGRAPAGFSAVECTVTLSTGASFTARRNVYVYDRNNSPITLTAVGADISTRDGWRMTLDLADSSLANLPEGTMVQIRLECTWNDSYTSVPSAVVDFTGWIVGETWRTTPGLRDGQVEVVGPGFILQQLINTSQRLDESGAPATWQEALPALTKARYMLHYLLSYHTANLLKLFDLTFDTTVSTDDRLPAIVAPRGTLWQQCKALAARCFLELTCDETGAIYCIRHPNRTTVGSRSSITNRATLTPSIYESMAVQKRINPPVGMARGSANAYDGAGGLTAYESRAPGLKAGQGSGEQTLTEQIVDSQETLNARTGLEYGLVNAEIESISVAIRKAWTVFSPAHLYFVQLQNNAALLPREAALNIRGIPSSVTRRYDHASGTMDVDITFEPETSGVDGATKAIETADTNLFGDFSGGDWAFDQLDTLFDVPLIGLGGAFTFDPASLMQLSDKPGAATERGTMYAATQDGYAIEFTWPGPAMRNVSPTSAQRTQIGTVYGMVVNPYNLKEYWLLGANGALRTTNIKAAAVTWTFKAFTLAAPPIAGTFQGVPGRKQTYFWLTGSGSATWSYPFDFASSNGGWTLTTGLDYNGGSYGSGRWNATNVGGFYRVSIQRQFVAATLTSIRMIGYRTTNVGDPSGTIKVYAGTTLLATYTIPTTAQGALDFTLSGTFTGATRIEIIIDQNAASDCYVASVTVGGSGLNPYTGATPGTVRFYWTLDAFTTIRSTAIAAYDAAMTYGLTVRSDNWRLLWATAGTPGTDAKVYKSTNGGASFSATSRTLNTRGGPVWMNRSTQAANVRNTSESNLLTLIGLDGSNNVQITKGIPGTPTTIVTDAARYPETGEAIYALPRDLDFVNYAARTGHFYRSSNAGSTWAASASAIPGGAGKVVRGISGWPTDSNFVAAFGVECIAYSVDRGDVFVDLWSSYDAWRSANLGSAVGKTIVAFRADLSAKYPSGIT